MKAQLIRRRRQRQFELEATYYGPGVQISDMRGVLHSLLVNAHTMVDENTLDLRFGVSLKPTGNEEQTERIADMYIQNLTQGFLEDVEIWETKPSENYRYFARTMDPL